MKREPRSPIELLQSTLDLLVLRTLFFGPNHGHAIATRIQRTSEELLQVEPAPVGTDSRMGCGWCLSLRNASSRLCGPWGSDDHQTV